MKYTNAILANILNRCVKECTISGIEVGEITDIKINNRPKHRLGQCIQKVDGTYEIEISGFFLTDDVEDIIVRSTVMHEVLHTSPGCMNHGKTWTSNANYVNKKYGYKVSRCFDVTANAGVKNSYLKSSKYIYKCDKCGNKVGFNRKCKFTKFTHRYSCGLCGGKFKRISGIEVA